MTRSPKSVRHLLKDKPTLKLLELEISAQKALLGQIRRHLPDEIAEHCVAARLYEQRLTIHVDSSVWATRLRYLAPRLLSLLRDERVSLREIRIRLLPIRNPVGTRPIQARRSDFAAAIIHDTATGTKQSSLREALERLSRTLKTQK